MATVDTDAGSKDLYQQVHDGPNGEVFLGRNVDAYGEDGTGWTDYDPDYECGGPEGTPGRQCPHKPRRNDESDTATQLIHVSIASYRDPHCPNTLLSMFYNAVNPKSIRVMLLQQNDSDQDVDCVEEYCALATKMKGKRRGNVGRITHHGNCPHADQINVRRINANKAAGPMHARGLVSEAMASSYSKGELNVQDYCLTIDSHMQFDYDWDKDMVEMWGKADNEYAILSTRPADLQQLEARTNGLQEVPHLCTATFTSNVRMGEGTVARSLSKPKLTNGVWSAGMSFSKCHAELKVPVDPHSHSVFDGDEFNRAVRFWTYGYDMYSPNRIAIAHDYQRSRDNPVALGWKKNNDESWNNALKQSHIRLKTIAGMPGGEKDETNALRLRRSKFGLGDRRSLEQYIRFSGIDFVNSKFPIDDKNRCGNVQWVSFPEHPEGVNYIPSFDGDTEDPIDAPDETSVWHALSNGDSRRDRENDTKGANARSEVAANGQGRNNVRTVDGDNTDNGPKGQDEDKAAHNDFENLNEDMEQEKNIEEGGDVATKETIDDDEARAHVKPAIINTQKGTPSGNKQHIGNHFQPGNMVPNAPAKRLRQPKSKTPRAGLHELPPLVQMSVVLLVLGVALSIFIQKGTGVGRKKFLSRKKRAL